MAKKDKGATTDDPAKMSRRRQIIETYRMTKETDRVIGLWMLGAFLVGGGIGFGDLLDPPRQRAPSPW